MGLSLRDWVKVLAIAVPLALVAFLGLAWLVLG